MSVQHAHNGTIEAARGALTPSRSTPARRCSMATLSPHVETWRPVYNFEGYYETSSLGAVRRIAAGRGATPGRHLKRHTGWGGYPVVKLSKLGESYTLFVHRLVAEAFLGPCPPGLEVNHLDSDRRNPCVSNLEYVTRSENVRHMIDSGRQNTQKGEDRPGSKLTEGDVKSILKSDLSTRELAEEHGVHHSTISDIKHRKKWAHVDVDGVVETGISSKWPRRRAIVAALTEHGAMTRKELALETGLDPKRLSSSLYGYVRRGTLLKIGPRPSKYALP